MSRGDGGRSLRPTPPDVGELSVQLVGGPTAVLELGGVRVVTDPTFSPAGAYESVPGRPLTKTEDPAFGAAALGPVDLVLLSHDQHADNLDPAGREVVAAAPLTLTTPSAAARLGGTARALGSWESWVCPRPDGSTLHITAVPARHGPEGCEPVTGEVTGFLLRGRHLPSVYVSGDNASLDLVEQIGLRVRPVDVALLFAGAARTSLFDRAPLTLTGVGAAAAAQLLGARWVVPLHTRGWTHFSEGPEDVRAAFTVAGLGPRLRTLAPGEKTSFSAAAHAAGEHEARTA